MITYSVEPKSVIEQKNNKVYNKLQNEHLRFLQIRYRNTITKITTTTNRNTAKITPTTIPATGELK